MEERTLEQIFKEKVEDRRERARRPYADKIRALVRMQKRNASILKLRGKSYRVWEIDL